MWQTDDESGITLVEIMLSLVLLGIVLTAFFTVVTGGLRSLSESRARQTSSQLSTEIIEELRRMSPSEIAMHDDPNDTSGDNFDASTVSCTDGGGTTQQGWFDPDGDGPLDCEEIETAIQGAITSNAPFQATTAEGITVTTIATLIDDPNVPDGTVRVTVVTEYALPAGSEEIRRSGLFSEVSRG